jgi:hypothetical protein
MTNKQDVVQALNCSVNGQNIDYGTVTTNATSGTGYLTVSTNGGTACNAMYYDNGGTSLWGYWQNQYYPYVIRESYPIYIQEKAMDKGKQAFELLKALMDKGLVKVDKVKDFIEAMDTILKTL